MRNRFQDFMNGRYGNDQLNQFMSVAALILIVLNIFLKIQILFFAALVLLILLYIRMFSRNYAKRQLENERFLNLTARFRRGGYGHASGRGWDAASRRARSEQRKIYRFFQCPHCAQKVRVPKGRGRIEITCPKCRTAFIKRT